MTMGERIRQARLEAGLSQRQLAGDEITRNMLSAMEHDGAKPSIATLRYLSDMLCKPIGYFFGEERPEVPEASEMVQARVAFAEGNYRVCLEQLEGLKSEEFIHERKLLEVLATMELAREALEHKRLHYAQTLLEQARNAGEGQLYFGKELENKWLVLAAQAAQRPAKRSALVDKITGQDAVLYLKAQAALDSGDPERAGRILDAIENQREPQWNWLKGEAFFAKGEYAEAVKCYRRAEEKMPAETGRRLEICYRELEDYKMAYYYAAKRNKQ